jgi:hypothetical protein
MSTVVKESSIPANFAGTHKGRPPSSYTAAARLVRAGPECERTTRYMASLVRLGEALGKHEQLRVWAMDRRRVTLGYALGSLAMVAHPGDVIDITRQLRVMHKAEPMTAARMVRIVKALKMQLVTTGSFDEPEVQS